MIGSKHFISVRCKSLVILDNASLLKYNCQDPIILDLVKLLKVNFSRPPFKLKLFVIYFIVIFFLFP